MGSAWEGFQAYLDGYDKAVVNTDTKFSILYEAVQLMKLFDSK